MLPALKARQVLRVIREFLVSMAHPALKALRVTLDSQELTALSALKAQQVLRVIRECPVLMELQAFKALRVTPGLLDQASQTSTLSMELPVA